MGLGGGFMATIYDASTGKVSALNARERAPALATPGMFNNKSSKVGGLATAVPGELRGYEELHRAYGKLPWADLVKPTAELCRTGHQVNEYMARALKKFSNIIKAEPSMSEIYVDLATNDTWKEGDIIKEPIMAKTLDTIAVEGPDAIHDGSLTAPLVKDIQGYGGIITEDDMRNYRPEWQEPIVTELLNGYTLYSNPLPGSGSVLAFILNMMQGWIGRNTSVGTDNPLYWHRVIESLKFAYAKRTGLGDPLHSEVPFNISELERNLSDPSWAKSYRNQVNDSITYQDWQHYGPMFSGPDDHGTAHAVVMAPDGSVVSVTSSVNYIWGCQRRSKSLGVILNSQMADFSIPNLLYENIMPPSPANMLAPKLQPLSSMVPSIVLNDGAAMLAIGAAGGMKITAQVAISIMSIILENEELTGVIDRPRIHHQLIPMKVYYERDFDSKVIEFLKQRGHETPMASFSNFGSFVAAARNKAGYIVALTDK